jgi:lipoate-protein ligase A
VPSCWILKDDDIESETNKRAMQVIESSSTDAAVNAAIEESVFRRPEITEPILMLYRNGESVLFGRNQNPWAECDVAHCLEEKIVLLRRLSGGGTVYQDAGNLNYSFFLPRSDHDPKRILEMLQEVLRGIGVQEVGLRDGTSVCSGGRKLSGTAFALNGRVAMLHGCILAETDLGRLHVMLSRQPGKTVVGSFVKSNRVPVTSLKELGIRIGCDELAERLVAAAEKEFGVARRTVPPQSDDVEALREKYAGVAWTFGRCGDFEIRQLTGGGLLILRVSQGIVTSAQLDGCDVKEFVDMPLHEIM